MQSFRLLSKCDSDTNPTFESEESSKGEIDYQTAANRTKAEIRLILVSGNGLVETWYRPETESMPRIQLVLLGKRCFLLVGGDYC